MTCLTEGSADGSWIRLLLPHYLLDGSRRVHYLLHFRWYFFLLHLWACIQRLFLFLFLFLFFRFPLFSFLDDLWSCALGVALCGLRRCMNVHTGNTDHVSSFIHWISYKSPFGHVLCRLRTFIL
ncbi:uncharacterized protein EI97DRAFT_142978 [Westerdykella ornata]|uniref:Uncharacterized protein n=1 Tax=Westerdykella ornata TaxID=318751 RepID=A0A6A6JC10_WESOR|nr:uncharacterized protein EI97DRAFT_142978 [Westerdykella ornata]KAF2273754.1 hypothetical protein EI97DRAFT_142978 [Westerdykella ornata]